MAGASFNRVILLGNITRDIEIKYLQSGMAVTEIGLAVNDRRKDQSGAWVDETTFVDITLWGRTAEVAGEYLSKGSPVLIEGRLKLDTWETDGQKRSKLKVVGEKLQMLGSKGGGGGGGGGGGSSRGQSGSSQSYDDADYGEPAGHSSGPSTSAAPRSAPARQAPPPAPPDDIPF